MTTTYVQTARQAELNAYAALFGAAAQLAFFSGTPPTDVDTALSSNPICARVNFNATPFVAATAAKPSVLAANAITQQNAWSTVTATFYRAYAQGTAGITGSSFVVGKVYQIQAAGTSVQANWASIGYTGSAFAVGDMFVATGTTLTGSGTCYLMNEQEQGTIGTSGADLNLNTTSIVAGGPVAITSFQRSM